MAKQLPEDWINGKKTTLNVSVDLGIKGSYPSNLFVLKQKGHKKLSCRWKPFEDEFYGTNPSEDWKKVNIDFFKENIISRDGYKRRYIFGHYTKYLIETLLGRFKLYILPIIKNSFDHFFYILGWVNVIKKRSY